MVGLVISCLGAWTVGAVVPGAATVSEPQADVGITKTAGASPVAPGRTITYTVTVDNAVAGSTATNLNLSDPVPAGTSLVSSSLAPGWTCAAPLSCTRASLASSAGPQAFTLVVAVNAGASNGSVITNTATVSADG